MKRISKLHLYKVFLMVMLVMATACIGLFDESPRPDPPVGDPARDESPTDESSTGELPTNRGYLRASHPRSGRLTVFDADTFEVYRTVTLPPSTSGYSHRLEIDPAGRIWIGYSQTGIDHLSPKEDRVLVFAPNGDLEHELDLGCSPLDTGIAFANGYAFVGCAASGFYGQVIVVDMDTMEVVKTFDRVHPPGEDPVEQHFYISAVAEAAGSVVLTGFGNPPRDYPRVTNSASAVTKVGVIDPETLTFRGYLTGFEPGLRILNVLEVDGKAWLFNELSHLAERPARTDVYVMDPRHPQIVDRLNLDHPFPNWAEHGDDGVIYIFHEVSTQRWRDAGYQAGITRLDLATGMETFIPTPTMPHAPGMGVYRDRPCLAGRDKNSSGLWCLNEDGSLELKVPQEYAIGVAFAPTGD